MWKYFSHAGVYLGKHVQHVGSRGQLSLTLNIGTQNIAFPLYKLSLFIIFKYNTRKRKSASVYYNECKPKNKKRGRPGNEASIRLFLSFVTYPTKSLGMKLALPILRTVQLT